ncbi:MAG: AAA family ATPase [bacterium]
MKNKQIFPKKIAILGCSGSGKTTFAKLLAQELNLPVFHLDQVSWKPGWVKEEESIIKENHHFICSKEQWIIDGNQINYLQNRIEHADMIIFFNIARWKCFFRIFSRWFRFYKKQRPDLAPGCFEQLRWGYLSYVWKFNKHYTPSILKLLTQAKKTKKVCIFNSNKDAHLFIKKLLIEDL